MLRNDAAALPGRTHVNLRRNAAGRLERALHPGIDARQVIAGEIHPPLRLQERRLVLAAGATSEGSPAPAIPLHAVPGDGEPRLELSAVLRVDAPALLERERQPLGRRALADAARTLVLDVVADHDSCAAVEPGRGIDDLRDVLVGTRRAAIDAVVLLPEPPLEVQADLPGGGIRERRDRA